MIKTPLFSFLFFPFRIFSQSTEIFKPYSVRKQVIATKINSSLHIDAVLNEPEWLRAKASPRFTQIEPFQGAAPSFETEVKVLYNKQYLYFGIFAQDSLGKKAIRIP